MAAIAFGIIRKIKINFNIYSVEKCIFKYEIEQIKCSTLLVYNA